MLGSRAALALGAVAFAGVVLVSALALPTDAWAQSGGGRSDIQTLINRIERLQRDMNTLQRQVYRGGGGAASGPAASSGIAEPNLAAAMQVRLDEIETQMRGFTGKLEVLQHDIAGVKKRLDKLASDIDYRLKALESRPAATGVPPVGAAPPYPAPQTSATPPHVRAAPAQPGVLGTLPLSALEGQNGKVRGTDGRAASPPAGRSAKSAPPPLRATPEAQYKHATDLLFRSDFSGAEKALSAFVAAHPKHQLAGNAQYWLGESHYARGAYRSAAAIFAEGYQKYPNSAKAPDNLLKLGMSLAAIDKKKSACATFKRLLDEFPKSSRTVRSRAQSWRKKLHCR